MAKNKLNAIKIQLKGSQSDLTGTIITDVSRPSNLNCGGRHISFDDSCKKDDGDEVCVHIYV